MGRSNRIHDDIKGTVLRFNWRRQDLKPLPYTTDQPSRSLLSNAPYKTILSAIVNHQSCFETQLLSPHPTASQHQVGGRDPSSIVNKTCHNMQSNPSKAAMVSLHPLLIRTRPGKLLKHSARIHTSHRILPLLFSSPSGIP